MSPLFISIMPRSESSRKPYYLDMIWKTTNVVLLQVFIADWRLRCSLQEKCSPLWRSSTSWRSASQFSLWLSPYLSRGWSAGTGQLDLTHNHPSRVLLIIIWMTRSMSGIKKNCQSVILSLSMCYVAMYGTFKVRSIILNVNVVMSHHNIII